MIEVAVAPLGLVMAISPDFSELNMADIYV